MSPSKWERHSGPAGSSTRTSAPGSARSKTPGWKKGIRPRGGEPPPQGPPPLGTWQPVPGQEEIDFGGDQDGQP